MSRPSRYEIEKFAADAFAVTRDRLLMEAAEKERLALGQARLTGNSGAYLPALIKCKAESVREMILSMADAYVDAFTLYGVPSDPRVEKALQTSAQQMTGGSISAVRGQLRLRSVRLRIPEEGQGMPWHLEIERSMHTALKEGVLRLVRQRITYSNNQGQQAVTVPGMTDAIPARSTVLKAFDQTTDGTEELAIKERTPPMALFGSSRPVTIVRGAGTPLEQRWGTEMGGDFNRKALFPPETKFAVNDEIHGGWLDEPRIIVSFGPEVVRTGLSHWRADILPRGERERRREEQKVLALKSRDGRAFPKTMFHAIKTPVMVHSQAQQNELGTEWSEEYIYQPYPRCKYHWIHTERVVKSLEEELTLRDGWGAPDDFAPYRGIPRVRSQAHDPKKWVDKWPVVGLSAGHRGKIKAQLLKGDATFWHSPESDSADRTSMKLAFDGIAKVLFEAHLLTDELLENEIATLVWDSSIAGGWYRFASELPESIFPEPLGHYWVWRDERIDWNALFRSEQAKWQAELLEGDSLGPQRVPRRARRRDPGIQQIEQQVRKLRANGLSDKDICRELGDSARPPRVIWRDLTWPAAYRRYTSAVAKWLSNACAPSAS